VDLSRSDLVLGTSAGSVVGAALSAGIELSTLPRLVAGRLPLPAGSDGDIRHLMSLTARSTGQDQLLAQVIDYALTADTLTEAHYARVRAYEANRSGAPSRELFRLSTLETLLHTTRAAAVAVGADLEVIGSMK
jgi:hypothetical protein